MDREKPRKSGISRNLSIKSVKNVGKAMKNATKATIDKIGDKDLDISERTATQMAISGRTLKRKPSFQIDAKSIAVANQSIMSNGLDELDFGANLVFLRRIFFFDKVLHQINSNFD